jgi:hypothetical protein
MTSPSIAPAPAARKAWREPYFWMVWSIPGLTIVAGLFTWWIAAQRQDSDVSRDYSAQGLVINRVLEREQRARELDIGASIAVSDQGKFSVRLRSNSPLPEAVLLILTHPVRAELDRRIALAIQPDGSYASASHTTAEALHTATGRWTLAVESPQWRLVGQGLTLKAGEPVALPVARKTS